MISTSYNTHYKIVVQHSNTPVSQVRSKVIYLPFQCEQWNKTQMFSFWHLASLGNSEPKMASSLCRKCIFDVVEKFGRRLFSKKRWTEREHKAEIVSAWQPIFLLPPINTPFLLLLLFYFFCLSSLESNAIGRKFSPILLIHIHQSGFFSN